MADEEKQKPSNPKMDEGAPKPTVLGGMVDLFKANLGDTIAYVVMALGLIVCFFEPFIGGLPVGFIMGLYFSKKIFDIASEFRDFLVSEGIFRSFIMIASIVALVISAPGLSLGLFFGSLARPLFGSSIHSHDTEDRR